MKPIKFKFGKRSLTFMIIPHAGRSVMRFRVSSYLLYMIPIIMLSTACVILFLQYNNMKNISEKNRLALELANKTSVYERTLSTKDLTINELQNRIEDIASQTEAMQQKIEELRILEEEIREVTEGEESISSITRGSKPVTIAAANAARGVGGVEIELEEPTSFSMYINKTTQTPDLAALQLEADDLIASITSAKQDLIAHMNKLRITPSIWPTLSTDISSTYGYRRDPFTRRSAYHAGVDIAGDRGDPIYVTADGIVSFAGYDSAYGYNVLVRHDSGLTTRYAHMLKNLHVKTGDQVKQGDQVGELGSTGRSTGPHLHYEVIKNGKTIDPMPYMDAEER